jgi:hypothetical protein
MCSILISLLAYFIASWYFSGWISQYLEPSLAKKMVVFLMASIVSWIIGASIDWAFPAQAIHLF